MRQESEIASPNENEAIYHLKRSVYRGIPWYYAVLEAIALWTCPVEKKEDKYLVYLIDNEAFDWLLLAQRLVDEIRDVIPDQELEDLLFYSRLPDTVTEEKFRATIGAAKYHAYLNFLYGILVEKFVVVAVEEEINKERHACIFSRQTDDENNAYKRVYGKNHNQLLKEFVDSRCYANEGWFSLLQEKEFTYWLFKYRLKHCDKEKIASDTRKGLDYLRNQKWQGKPHIPDPEQMNRIWY